MREQLVWFHRLSFMKWLKPRPEPGLDCPPTLSLTPATFSISPLLNKAHNLVLGRERQLSIDNLLGRIHVIIEMILVDRPCAMGV